MGDPRNVAHANKVTQEKQQHEAKHAQKAGASRPAKKAQIADTNSAPNQQRSALKPDARKAGSTRRFGAAREIARCSLQVKELVEFHSRSNVEKLAELSLTIEEELKQKAFA